MNTITSGILFRNYYDRFGARWILGTDPELALYGWYVLPQRLIDSGFSFEFPDLDSALRDLR